MCICKSSCMEHRLWGRLLQLSGALAREERALNGSADIRQQPPPHCSERQVPRWCRGTPACVPWVWGVGQ